MYSESKSENWTYIGIDSDAPYWVGILYGASRDNGPDDPLYDYHRTGAANST